MLIDTIIRRAAVWLVYGGSFSMRPYEQACIAEFRTVLNTEGRRLLDEQLQWLDRFKRLSKDSVVHFFSTRVGNGERLPIQMLFPRKDDELRIGRVTLKFVDQKVKALNATIILERGELMSIQFSRSPREIAAMSVSTATAKLLQDPMVTDPIADDRLIQTPVPNDWIRQNDSLIRDLTKPLEEKSQAAIVEGIEAKLPEEYLQWMKTTNGFFALGVHIYGLNDVWSAPRPDGVYFVFGQSEKYGDIAVKGADSSMRVYLLDFDSDKAHVLESSLAQFIETHKG